MGAGPLRLRARLRQPSQKLSYDFWYMRHGSLAVDIAVCVETFLQVLGIFSPRRLSLRRGPRGEPAA